MAKSTKICTSSFKLVDIETLLTGVNESKTISNNEFASGIADVQYPLDNIFQSRYFLKVIKRLDSFYIAKS